MPNKTHLSIESIRLLIWLTNDDLTFTKMGQRFNHHKVDHNRRNKIVDELVEAGYAAVNSDRHNISRLSKGGRPQRTLSITDKGKKLIKNIEEA